MPATAKHIKLARTIEMKMRRLLGAGLTDLEILVEMHGELPAFNRLFVDGDGGQDALIELCQRLPSFHRYTKILVDLGAVLRAGAPG